jgi:hypothetical protein
VNRFPRLLPLVGACFLIQACATPAPPARAVPPPPAAMNSAPPPADTAATATKTNRIVLEDKTLTNDEIKALFAQGYKPTSRDGQVYYCRKEMTTGSRFSTMTCRTAEQMKQRTQDSKDVTTAAQKQGGCHSQGGAC